ncbi:protein of unknown function (DUF4328) [Streptoalloteichus tenebrarius]|uniref:DUF4328 domain-containing protein n=2 Tax=Streptoalloteichus tenebrarius (strain ATCC 17920 / DSM 40477 / JCM 4838 / CBS 697.72 / NBRC 16177 / NCIMB 11028 / NRRL B-12390 / A12253. 1 / ISP 5477) TaxID=1933 RepID=A0ABT1HYC0_STRSD|nr:protein of unknown function (DUF4328) [Streptoalloteichus tenebrarius]BFF01871.1 hypothetical protein GCM10020241_35460 [Streptoalloteichus tenebrarius]
MLAWRRPTALPGRRTGKVGPVERVRALVALAVPLLWLTAGGAGLGALAELWRYVLLAMSRDSMLSAGVVRAAEILAQVAGVVALLTGVLSAVVLVLWLLRAREAAADLAEVRPARPTWQVLVGLLTPGLNLVQAGQLLGELEHTALRLPPDRRPRPSRLVVRWWAAWAANGVLAGLTLLWGLRSSLQAQADTVLLHALTDAAAVVVAVFTIHVVRMLTGLLAPADPAGIRRQRVVRVVDAEEPLLRPPHPSSRR